MFIKPKYTVSQIAFLLNILKQLLSQLYLWFCVLKSKQVNFISGNFV